MNRGLVLALLLLAFVIVLVGADAILMKDAINENEARLSALDETEVATQSEVSRVLDTFDRTRFLISVSVPLERLNEYDEALAALTASVLSGESGAYAAARAEAMAALTQIKRSALFSLEQIL